MVRRTVGGCAIVGLVAIVAGGCIPSEGLARCASGVICPDGTRCSDDGETCIDIDARCGNGVIDVALGEECDCGDPGSDPAPGCELTNSDSALGSCRTDCLAHCGDEVIGDSEECEGEPVVTACVEYGFDAGRTECSSACALDFTSCENIGFEPLSAIEASNIVALWADESGLLFAARSDGVAAYDGLSWQSWELDTEISAVWGFAVDDVFAGGDGGVWHFDGTDWTQVLVVDGHVRSIHGRERTHLVAVGHAGQSLEDAWHFDGSSWSLLSSDGHNFDQVWIDDQARILVTEGPEFLRLEGTWQSLGSWGTLGNRITGVASPAPGLLYASSGVGIIDVSDLDCLQATCPQLMPRAGNQLGKLFATGDELFLPNLDTLLYSDGIATTRVRLTAGSLGASVWAFPGGRVFYGGGVDIGIGGFLGTSSTSDGWFWGELLDPNVAVLDTWVSPGGQLWVATNSGPMRQVAGMLEETGLSTVANRLEGSSDASLFAVTPSDVFHFDGNGWSEFPTAGALTGVTDLSTTGPDDAIFADRAGSVHIWDGSTLVSFDLGWSLGVDAVWGSREHGYFAGGRPGVATLVDNQWVALQTDQPVFAMWGLSGSEVYAVGGQGLVMRFDGSAWQRVEVPTIANLIAIDGSGADDIIVAGVSFFAVHFDGDAWSPMRLKAGMTTQVAVTATSVYLTSNARELDILHRRR